MEAHGDVSARDRARDSSPTPANRLAGQAVIAELLRVQAVQPSQSRFARVWGVNPLSRDAQSWYRAALGEISVGDSLDALGPEWVVLHAVPVGEGTADIDHVVIGPGGVFIVNTTSHPGLPVWASQRTFMVADIRYPYIRNMEYEMGRAERLLSTAVGSTVEVSGILAVVAPKSLVVRDRQRDVAVLQSSHLVSWLTRQKRALSPAEVAGIGEAASLASTWYPAGIAPEPAPALQRDRFEALRSEVQGAWRVQLCWAIGVSIVAVGTFVGITYSILVSAIGSFGV